MMEKMSLLTAAFTAMLVTAVSGLFIIPALHRMHFGQTIKEIGPTWHAGKNGTPTMGGLTFYLGDVLGVAAGYAVLVLCAPLLMNGFASVQSVTLYICLLTAFAFGAVGFVDDYIKVVKKRNLGLRARAKIVAQVLITAAFLCALVLNGTLTTYVTLPVFGTVDFGYAFYPVSFLLIIGMVNAVNLTDGIDGLCSSVTTVYMIVFSVIAALLGAFGHQLLAYCAAGGCIGFLTWNAPPAKVFMGDTGSMFLGGIVCALGLGCNAEFLMVIAGIVFVLEALSVVIQSTVFKITKKIHHTKEGKRLFKMTPIHHHFELSDWSEIKIDIVFSIIGLLFGGLAILAAFNMFGR